MQGKKVLASFKMNNQKCNAPEDWQSLEVLATFDNDNIQAANITTSQLTFVLEEYNTIMNYIDAGLTGGEGVFQGLPFSVALQNKNNQYTAFDGMLDLTDSLEIDEDLRKIKAKMRVKNGLISLEEKLQSLSYGYLKDEKNLFSSSDYTDIEYKVLKKVNIVETIMISISIYLMIKELQEAKNKIIEDIAEEAGDGILGIITKIVHIILSIIYYAIMIAAILNLANTLLVSLIPIKRKAKALKLKTALSKVITYLGYTLQTNITDLDNVYYIPSNFNLDEVDNKGVLKQWKGNSKGIPCNSDYGYNCLDMFTIAKNLFEAKYVIENERVYFYNEYDPVWIRLSTLNMPSVIDQKKYKFNADELVANKMFSFDYDITEEKTIENWQGTNYEVITDAIVSSNPKEKYIGKLADVKFGVCLGNRKDDLSGFENYLYDVAVSFDKVLSFFGKSSNFAGKIKSTIGIMVVGNNNYMKPKVVKLNKSNRLVPRSEWSAKYIYETYYRNGSFVYNNWYGQKRLYESEIPFGLDDFMKTITNSYCTDVNGKVIKIEYLKYNFDKDKAMVKYYIREPYTKNLKETYVEPLND